MMKMNTTSFAFTGLAFGGLGMFLGITMSSSIPSNPFTYGLAAALYAAIAAGVLAEVIGPVPSHHKR